MSDVKPPAGFSITRGCGFHITLDNGWTLSVQFGDGHYCDNKSDVLLSNAESVREAGKNGCKNAEIAVWGPDGDLINFSIPDGDTVKGHCSPNDVLDVLKWMEYK
jgi:hypothetical protein